MNSQSSLNQDKDSVPSDASKSNKGSIVLMQQTASPKNTDVLIVREDTNESIQNQDEIQMEEKNDRLSIQSVKPTFEKRVNQFDEPQCSNMETAEKQNGGNQAAETVGGKENAGLLLKKLRNDFYRNVPFERGLYQQCLPNPTEIDDGQYITVQLIHHKEDRGQQTMQKQSYKLERQQVLSDDTIVGKNTWKELKREAMRDDYEKSKKFSSFSEDEKELIRKLYDAQKTNAATDMSELNPSFMNDDDSDENSEEEDEGIKEVPYARVQKEKRKFYTQKEVAVIAFWKQTEQKVFYCHHYFFVPNPLKRQIKDADGTPFYSIIYKGTEDEMFFFYENNMKIQLGILNTRAISNDDRTNHQVEANCSKVVNLSNETNLAEFISKLNVASYADQMQMPNPTLLKKDGVEFVVFTESSFTLEGPQTSISFFNLDEVKVEWEIPGGEIFVDFTKNKGVTYITSEVKAKENKSTVLNKNKDKGPAEENRKSVNMVKWGDTEIMKSQSINFKSMLPMKKAEQCKVVEAILHNTGNRMTIIFYGLGAYTFLLKFGLSDTYIMYNIQNSDVQLVKLDQTVYIQANLKVLVRDEEDAEAGAEVVIHPQNTVTAYLTLYNVSEVSDEERKKSSKKRGNRIPTKKDQLTFLLSQSISSHFEDGNQSGSNINAKWHVPPIIITRQSEILGSIFFDEESYGNDEIVLEFFGMNLLERNIKKFPQRPIAQSYQVEYPMLAYKNFTPDNREVCLVNLATNQQKVLALGEFEFHSFVSHTQKVDQKIFHKKTETSVNIMFLASDLRGNTQLLGIRCKPWDLSHEEQVYTFTGVLPAPETICREFEKKDVQARRFSYDKVHSIQLITNKSYKEHARYQQFAYIAQYHSDGIVSMTLTDQTKEIKIEQHCKGINMVNRHMVRGYNDKVYYAHTEGANDKISKVEMDSKGKVSSLEMFSLANSLIMAIENDCQNMQNDIDGEVEQSLFLLDDKQKLYHLRDEGEKLVIAKSIEVPGKKLDVKRLYDTEWSRIHVSLATIVFDSVIYSLKSKLVAKMRVIVDPCNEEYNRESFISMSMTMMDRESEVFEGGENEIKNTTKWSVSSVNNVALTSFMLTTVHDDHKDFRFVLNPSPGSRSVDLVSYQHIQEIEDVLFITENHLLVKFRSGKLITFNQDGTIVHQPKDVVYALGDNPKVIAQSEFESGQKFVAMDNNHSLVLLKFTRENDGEATVEARFDNYINTMNDMIGNTELKEDEIFMKDTFLTTQGKLIKVAVRLNPEFGNLAFTKFTRAISGKHFAKVIVINCMHELSRNTWLHDFPTIICGDYLVQQSKKDRLIWVTGMEFENDRPLGLPIEIGPRMQDPANDNAHVNFWHIPHNSITNFNPKGLSRGRFDRYGTLLQVSVRNQAIIYDLDELTPANREIEVTYLENVDQFVDPDKFINTGFFTSVSSGGETEIDIRPIRKAEICTNEHSSLIFHREQTKKRTIFTGKVYRTCTELDFLELVSVNRFIDRNMKIKEIDPDTILSTFGGHTVFSLYSDEINVFKSIQKQLRKGDYPTQESSDGRTMINEYLTRLICLLQIPVTDLQRCEEPKKDSRGCFEKFIPSTNNSGFKNIFKKSLYFNNYRFRDILMHISNLNPQQTTISHWVNNLDDMKTLMENFTPVVLNSLQNSFTSTNFCKKTKHVKLTEDQAELNRNVFVKNSSVICDDSASELMEQLSWQGLWKTVEPMQTQSCNVSMLDVGWIFGETRDHRPHTYGDLMVIIDDAPREVYESELVKAVIEKEWKVQKNKIIMWKVVMLALYLTLVNYYYAAFMFQRNPPDVGISGPGRWECKNIPQAMRWLIFVFILYFLTIEALQLRRFGKAYFSAMNLFDLTGVLLNLLVMVGHMFNFLGTWKVRLATYSTFIMWIQIFRVLIVFDRLAFFLRLMSQLIWDIWPFAILFGVQVGMCANLYFLLQVDLMWQECVFLIGEEGCSKSNKTMHGIQWDHLFGSILNQYQLSLGDFNTDRYGEESVTNTADPPVTKEFKSDYDASVWVIFFFATLLSNVIILNVMIGIALDTYDRVASENREVVLLAKKANFLADYVWGSVFSAQIATEKYIYSLRPKKPANDTIETWEGSVKLFKKVVIKQSQELQASFKKEMASVRTEVNMIKDDIQGMIRQEFDVQKVAISGNNDKDSGQPRGGKKKKSKTKWAFF